MSDIAHLLDRLAWLERRIRDAVAERRGSDPHPDDPFRGLYLSDEAIDELLDARRRPRRSPGPSRRAGWGTWRPPPG